MNIPDILQYMSVIERPRTIRIFQLASKFIAVWFAVAGVVHLVENSGDFFCDFCNGQEIDLPNTVYFMIITMTTVREHGTGWAADESILGGLRWFLLQNIHWKILRPDLSDRWIGKWLVVINTSVLDCSHSDTFRDDDTRVRQPIGCERPVPWPVP